MTERRLLYMDENYSYPEEQDITSDTFTLYGATIGAGNLAMSNHRITGLPDIPTAGTDAVNQNYVDNVVSGLGWKDPVNVAKLIGNVQVLGLVGNAAASVIEALTVEGDAYVVTTADGSGALSTAVVGDIWQYVSSTWTKITDGSGGFVAADTYALLSTTTALISPYTDSTDDGKRAYFDGSTLTGALVTPDGGDAYVIDGPGATGEGDIWEWDGADWILVEAAVGGFVAAGVRAILGLAPAATLIAPYTEATDDGKIVDFTGSSNTGVDTGDAVDKAATLVQDTLHVGYYDNLGFVFEGTVPTGSWIQFTGAGQINAGIGLEKTGNTLNVLLGDGITELPSDYVGVHLSSSNPGLELTGTSPNKTLQAKADGAHGIVLGASGIEIEIDETPDTLDVDADGLKVVGLPSLFKVNGTAVGATVTATNLDTLTNASNADLLHTHASTPATEAPKVEDTHTCKTEVTTGRAVCWSSTANEIEHADNSADLTSQVIGVARVGALAAADAEIVKAGLCTGLSGLTVQTPYYLGAAGALVVHGSVPRPGRFIRVGFAASATALDVQMMDFGRRAS